MKTGTRLASDSPINVHAKENGMRSRCLSALVLLGAFSAFLTSCSPLKRISSELNYSNNDCEGFSWNGGASQYQVKKWLPEAIRGIPDSWQAAIGSLKPAYLEKLSFKASRCLVNTVNQNGILSGSQPGDYAAIGYSGIDGVAEAGLQKVQFIDQVTQVLKAQASDPGYVKENLEVARRNFQAIVLNDIQGSIQVHETATADLCKAFSMQYEGLKTNLELLRQLNGNAREVIAADAKKDLCRNVDALDLEKLARKCKESAYVGEVCDLADLYEVAGNCKETGGVTAEEWISAAEVHLGKVERKSSECSQYLEKFRSAWANIVNAK